MSLTTDQLDALARLADDDQVTHGELFEERTLPQLGTLDEGELWALAGMLVLDRDCEQLAKFVAWYVSFRRDLRIGAVGAADVLDPPEYWRMWQTIGQAA